MKLKTFHISHLLQWLQQDLLVCARQIKSCTGWMMEAAACLAADFFISPPPRKGSHSSKAFPRRKQAYPGAVSHSDSTARGDGESRENATAGIEPMHFTIWVGARTQHKVDFLLERLKHLTYSTVNRTVLLNLEFGGWYLGYRELLCSPSALSKMGSKDHREKGWREENEGATE